MHVFQNIKDSLIKSIDFLAILRKITFFLDFFGFLFVFQNIKDSLIKSIGFFCDVDVFYCFQNIKDSLIKSMIFRPNAFFEENLMLFGDFCIFLHVSYESSVLQVNRPSNREVG